MNGLEEKKKELLVICDIQRQLLRVEWNLVEAKVRDQWGRLAHLGHAWKWAAPVAGYMMARRFRRRHPPSNPVSAKLWMALKLWEWWRRRRAPKA